jgi:hypothetical protein
VLVSHGGDNCKPPDPCAVERQISRGVALKIQAVSFQVTEGARRQLQRSCARCPLHQGRGAVRGRAAARDRPPDPAGRYTTELRPGEEAWYAFEVGAGQAIAVSTTLPRERCRHPHAGADRARYAHALRGGEQLYGVELQSGQSVKATATVAGLSTTSSRAADSARTSTATG